jgi:hypothetical protein
MSESKWGESKSSGGGVESKRTSGGGGGGDSKGSGASPSAANVNLMQQVSIDRYARRVLYVSILSRSDMLSRNLFFCLLLLL